MLLLEFCRSGNKRRLCGLHVTKVILAEEKPGLTEKSEKCEVVYGQLEPHARCKLLSSRKMP